MTLDELNNHLTLKVKESLAKRKKYIGGKKKDIRTVYPETITLITEQPYKKEAIIYLVKNKPEYISKLCNLSYITLNDIKSIQTDCPEIYYCLPVSIYNEYPELLELLSNNNLVLYDLLPKELRDLEQIQQAFKQCKKIYDQDKRDRLGYDTDWLDENGNLRKFFELKNGFPIESKEEYMKIIEVYLSSDLSVSAFCSKYGISNIDGFNTLLKRAGYENTDIEKNISEVKDSASRRYLAAIGNIVESINAGEISFEDYITNHYNPYHKIDLIFNNLKDKPKFMNQLLTYLIDNKEKLMLDRLIKLFNTDLKSIVQTINSYFKLAGIGSPDIHRTLNQILNIYKTPYNRKDILTTITINGETKVIDDNIADQTLAYIRDNHIYLCRYTALNISKAIAFGKIDYKDETMETKEELKEDILRIALSKVNNIEGYLNVMEENYNINRK